MTIVFGDVLRVSANFTLDNGTLYQNVYHYQRTGVGILSDQEHVDAIETQMNLMYDELVALILPDILPDLSFVDLVDFVDGEWKVVENIGVFTPVLAAVGTGQTLPHQCSPFVTFKTTRPKSVGRKFLFPVSETMQDSTILAAAAITAIVAYADEALVDIVIQVLDNLVPGIIRTGVDSFLPIFVGVVTNVMGTQRRRRPGVGA